jgi:hypothetical protein
VGAFAVVDEKEFLRPGKNEVVPVAPAGAVQLALRDLDVELRGRAAKPQDFSSSENHVQNQVTTYDPLS